MCHVCFHCCSPPEWNALFISFPWFSKSEINIRTNPPVLFSPKNSSDLSSLGCCSLPHYSSEKQTSQQPEIDWLNCPPADSLSSVQSRLRPVPAWGHCVMSQSCCWLCLTASWSWSCRLAFWPPKTSRRQPSPGARCLKTLYTQKNLHFPHKLVLNQNGRICHFRPAYTLV